jgi:sodium transport system permease protein
VAAVLSIYTLQVLIGRPPPPGLAAMGATYAIVAIALVIAARGYKFSLGVRPARLRFWFAAVLVGVSAWWVDLQLVLWLKLPGAPEQLEGLVTKSALLPTLLAVALAPAVAEELVFRGVLARSLARHSAILAIVVSALAFSAYHVMPQQMVSTFPLGLALGILAIRSGSILPGMLVHFLNNAIVIVLSRDSLPSVSRAFTDHPTGGFAGALALMAVGVALSVKGVS